VGARVIITNSPSAHDFLDHEAYAPEHFKVLSPSELISELRRVFAAVRYDETLQPLSRPSETLISEAANSAVIGDFVVSRDQNNLYFLTVNADDEADYPIDEWATLIGNRMFIRS
jgi:predicted nucleic acid-binding protein